MVAGSERISHTWLRSASTGTARGVSAFLDEAPHRLPKRTCAGTVRADSGFSDFLSDLEERELSYALAVRMQRPVRKAIVALQKPRRGGLRAPLAALLVEGPVPIVVRQRLFERPDAAGRRLFDIPGCTFHAVITNLSLPPEEVWRFYNRRADCENRIKELDFAADGFCLSSFSGTEAVLQLNALPFNLIAAFKDEVLHDGSPTVGALRHSLFVLGVLADKTRYPLASLLERLDALIPTVAQLILSLLPHGGNASPHPKVSSATVPQSLFELWFLG